MFNLTEQSRKSYNDAAVSITNTIKNKLIEINPEYNHHYKGKKFNSYITFKIVKYYPSEFSYFNCGWMNPRVTVKSLDGKYRTTINYDHVIFVTEPKINKNDIKKSNILSIQELGMLIKKAKEENEKKPE